MGQEHLFCCSCSVRLLGRDFEQGKAFRVDDKACCKDCVEELVADLPADRQEQILHQHEQPAPRKGATGPVPTLKPEGGTRMRGNTQKITGTQLPVVPGRGTERVTKVRQPGTSKISTVGGGTRPIPRAGTQAIPKTPPAGDGAARKKKMILLAGAGGGGLVVLVIILLFVLPGGKKVESSAPAPIAAPPTKSPEADPNTPAGREKRAKQAVLDAQAWRTANAGNLGGQWSRFKAAAELAKGTADADSVEGFLLDIKQTSEREAEALIERTQPLFRDKAFKSLIEQLEKDKTLHDVPAWKERLDRRIAEVREEVKRRIETVRKTAVEAKSRGEETEALAQIEKVREWGHPAEADEIKAAVDGTTAKAPPGNPSLPVDIETKAASEAVKTYRAAWALALLPAFGHDFGAATTELEKAGREAGDADAKREAQADLEVLKRTAALYAEGLKVLAELPKRSEVDLEFLDMPSEYKKVTGTVLKANVHRLEISTAGDKPKIVFVENKAVSGGSIALLLRGRWEARPEDPELRALALLALLEGGDDPAKSILKGATNKLPGRYWEFGLEVRAKAPKAERREFESRKLFHGAELEWRSIKTWGGALDKYRLLQGDYSGAEIAKINADLIARRLSVGREYSFGAAQIRTGGEFRRIKPPAVPKVQVPESAVTSSKDPDSGERTLQNFAEVEFYALPATSYRCWAYVGACCTETFTFYYQTTEMKMQGKEIEPGSTSAWPVDAKLSGLKKTHAQHSKEAKSPARWEWVPLLLPKEYPAPGAKTVRVFTENQGFSVAYVVVSSTRKAAPNDAETRDLPREIAEAAGFSPGASAVKGTPDPLEWLLIGPFENSGINGAHPPETDGNLAKEHPGKPGKVKWEPAKATLQAAGGAKAAVFDFLPIRKPSENVTIYALIHVKVPSAMDARILAGSDDQMKIWVNGKVVHTRAAGGGVKVDEFTINVRLEAGWNPLLFKVCQGGGGWGLAARITDAQKKPIEGIEYHPFGDTE